MIAFVVPQKIGPGDPAPGKNGLILILPGRYIQSHDDTAGSLLREPTENKPVKPSDSMRNKLGEL